MACLGHDESLKVIIQKFQHDQLIPPEMFFFRVHMSLYCTAVLYTLLPSESI